MITFRVFKILHGAKKSNIIVNLFESYSFALNPFEMKKFWLLRYEKILMKLIVPNKNNVIPYK